ncbi:NBR1-Ig-like domain-containing protein [Pseudoduganella armeniaca]|uniref:Nbr1 FW domain-containing protein n=1 Tax=Pseudoduganella armeniaca TaxID=2072590 RepID=A0A2R4C641_9BURK|nr:NBR1-Ig-like domain-containing protein [Pseudoduganella armeniaca]AVR95083.1 hypothetical protein C9I28_04630 [Pseudoduganella armeniaca]
MVQQLLAAAGGVRACARRVYGMVCWLLLASMLWSGSVSAQVVFTSPAVSPTSGTAGSDGTLRVTFSGSAKASVYANAVNQIDVMEGTTVLNTVYYPVSYNPKTEAPVNTVRTISNAVALTPGTHTLRLVAYTEVAGSLATQDFVVTVASGAPVYSAQLLSENAPTTMYAGQQYNIAVTVQNTGNTTWTTTLPDAYKLGSQKPDNNTTWAVQRVPVSTPIAPGGSTTFNFTVTAPTSPGTYTFAWGMLQENQRWFANLIDKSVNVVTPPPVRGAELTPQSVPSSMNAGQSYTVSFNLKNTGNTTWTPDGVHPYFLGSQNPENNTTWGTGRIALASPLAPGASRTISFTVTAPQTPGQYNMRWQMVHEQEAWFGNITSSPITVTEALPTVTLSSPANGATYTASGGTATVSLSGSAAGTAGATISRLEFFDGATSLGYVASTSISLSKALAVGSHTIELRATDNRGKVKSAFATITVAGPAPTVALSAPANNAAYVIPSGSTVNVQVAGSVSSSGTITKLEVLDGTTPIHTTSGTSVNVALPLAAGKHALRLRATDSTGQVGTSAVSNVSVYATTAGKAAEFVSQSMPTTLRAGQPVTFSVSMINTGTTTWSEGEKYRLGAQNPQDNRTWGGRVYLSNAVAPGQVGVFTATVTAPQAPGTYNFQWRMVHEYVTWFGGMSDNASVTVASGAGPTATLTGTPTNVRVSGSNTAAVTLTGNGSRSGGTVSKIELFQANFTAFYPATPIKTVTGASSSLALSAPLNLPAGVHYFKLRSTDSAGVQTESAPVIVNVTNSALLGTIGGVRTNAAGTAELYGWTCQPGNAAALNYKVLLDAPSLESGATELTTGVANVATELDNASVQSQCATPGSAHHFVVNLSTYLTQYAGRRLYVWAETADKATTVSLPCAENNCTMPGTTRVGITTPTANATFVYPAPAFLKVKLTNYSGTFDEVGFYVNGQWIAAQPDGAAGEYSVQKTGLAASTTPYMVYAVARQGGTAIQSAVVPFYVSTGTSVTLTAPQNGASATAGIPLGMSATISSTAASVVFYANGSAVATGSLDGGAWKATWTPAQSGTFTVLARALDGTGSKLGESAAVTVTVTPGSGSSATPLPVTITPPYLDNADAGTLPGDVTIGKDGAAHYAIPLPVPPGPGGLQPALSLNYSSAGSNGMVGVGWTLTGLSQIHRCAKTVAQDGIAGRVSFNNADRLCLDGQRLLRVDGANPGTDAAARDAHYWASGATYRTEEDNFARVTRLASGGFKVEEKGGLVRYYGTDTNSAVVAQGRGDGQALLWAMARTEDRSGNYMTAEYNYDGQTGEFTPRQLRYGGNTAAAQAPFLAVRFAYNSRSDAQVLYLGGSRSDMRSLLASVNTYIDTSADGTGGMLVRQHEIGYQSSSATGRSLVSWMQASAVKPETGAVEKLPRTDFTPGTGSAPAFTQMPITPFSLPTFGRGEPGRLQGDFDGSGRTTFIAAEVIPCGGTGEFPCIAFPNPTDGIFTGKLRLRLPDGRTIDRVLNQAALGFRTGTKGGIMSYTMGDVNGDGRDDIIAIDSAEKLWGACLSITAADGMVDFSCMPGATGGKLTPVDLRNDRRMHLLSRFDTNGYAQDCYLDGAAFRCDTIHLNELPPLPLSYNRPLKELDFFKVIGVNFSREGMSDLYSVWDNLVPAADPNNPYAKPCDNGTCWAADKMVGITTCFNGQPDFNCRAIYQGRSVGRNVPVIETGKSVGDLNGDGLSDFAFDVLNDGAASGTYVCLSMEVNVDCRTQPTLSAYTSYLGQSKIGDFVGDGVNRLLISLFPLNRFYVKPAVPVDAMLCATTANGYSCEKVTYTDSYNHVTEPVYMDDSGVPAFLVNTGELNGTQAIYKVMTMKGDPSRDRMVRVTNGLGHTVEIDYGRADDASLYQRNAVVDGVTVKPVYPQVAVNPGVMVKQLRVSNNNGGWLTSRYRYAGAMIDAQGRGTLGFTTFETVDAVTANVTVNTFHQSFPYIGLTKQTKTTASNGTVLNDSRFGYVAKTTAHASGAASIFAVLERSEEKVADLDGSDAGTTTIVNAYEDGWGNLTGRTVTRTGGGKTFVSTTAVGYKNDSANWLIGLPESTVASEAAPGTSTVTRTTTQQYDTAGRLWKQTQEPGTALQVVTTYGRANNKFGLVDLETVEWTDPATAALKSRTERDVGYEAKGRFAQRIANALGHAESATYYPGTGTMRTRTDANNLVTRWTVDGFGRVGTVTEPDGNQQRVYWKQCAGACPLGAGSVRIEERFNGSSRIQAPVVRFEDASGRQLRVLGWNVTGAETWADIRYDAYGRLEEVYQPRFANASAILAYRLRYDGLGRMDRITTLDETNREVHSTVAYKGLVRVLTNRKNQVREERRNMLGLIDQVTDSLRGVTKIDHYGTGDVAKTTDPNGNVITVEYDRLGRRTDLRDPDLGWTHYDVDPLGRVWKQTSPNQRPSGFTRFEYDALDRTTGRYEAKLESHWAYDTAQYGVGKLARAYTVTGTGADDYNRVHSYDTLGREATVSTKLSDATYQQTTQYDAWSRPVRLSYQRGSGAVKNFDLRYNANGFPVRVERDALVLWRVTEMDAALRATGVALGNGLTQRLTYDPYTGRLSEDNVVTAGSARRLQQGYAYDALGNVKQRTQYWESVGFSEMFDYDELNRLTMSQVSGQAQQVFGYGNAAGNLTSKTGIGTYTYPPRAPTRYGRTRSRASPAWPARSTTT